MSNFINEQNGSVINNEPKGFKHPDVRNKAKISLCKKRRAAGGLCEHCGTDTPEHKYGVECVEDYSTYDKRDKKIKKSMKKEIKKMLKEDDRVVVVDEIKIVENIVPEVKIKKSKSIPDLLPDQEPVIKMKYIVIDITTSADGSMFDADFINFYAKHYSNHIIVLTGSPKGYPPFFTFVETKRQKNISDIIISTDEQTTINYLSKCDLFITFYSDYVLYCRKNKIKCICFMTNGDEKLENEYVSIMDMAAPMLITTKIFSQITTDSFLPI